MKINEQFEEKHPDDVLCMHILMNQNRKNKKSLKEKALNEQKTKEDQNVLKVEEIFKISKHQRKDSNTNTTQHQTP